MQQFCRDRYGPFPVMFFRMWSCSMCYKYIFHTGAQLAPLPTDPTRLGPADGSNLSDKRAVVANITNSSARNFVCSTLTNQECDLWTECCHNAIACCDEQLKVPLRNVSQELFCPRTWDGFGCFTDAQPGERLFIDCPSYIEHASPFSQGYKDCTVNGTWYTDPQTRSEWTNYSTCLQTMDFHMLVYLGLACNIASIILLFPACLIFLCTRQLRTQKRIKLHVCLFLSFMLTAMVTIMWDFLVYLNRLDNTAEKSIMYQNTGGCKFLYILSRYVRTANFFWMFCEGFYLHRLIVHAFSVPKTLMPYYIFGWGFSWIPALIYAIIRASKPEFNERCWVENIGLFEWFMYVPNLLCIAANLVFICNILRILCSKLQAHPNEPSNYRKALKATFVLVPLFGLQQFLVIYRPKPGSSWAFGVEVFHTIVNNTQGAAVALIFCFFNGEVHTYVKNYFQRRWKRGGSRGEYSRKGSTSSATQFTTMQGSTRRGTRTYEPSAVPGYIPLSTSSTANDGLTGEPQGNGHVENYTA